MIVGVTGYGYTGSSAFVDLLSEYEELKYKDTGHILEFSLPYETDGLLDLEFHLTKCPAKHLKGDSAILRFRKLLELYRKSYDRATGGKFSDISEGYLKKLIQVEYSCHTTDYANLSRFGLFREKVLRVIQGKLERRWKRYVPLLRERTRYISVYPKNFEEDTRKFLADIIAAMCPGVSNVLLDQPFPPNNPEDVFHFFEDPYAIVVERDPRDIYVLVKHLCFSGARFVPHDCVEDFVAYYKNVSQRREDRDPSRVLRLRFEDLVYDYSATVKKIEDFLHISRHITPGEIFNPEESIRNTNMRDLYPEDREDMEYIERELKEYLFPFEKYGRSVERSGLYEIAAKG